MRARADVDFFPGRYTISLMSAISKHARARRLARSRSAAPRAN